VISITRLPEPAKLIEKKEQWLATYLKKRETKPGSRPDSRQYGHPKIRNDLRAMSADKCFYCEHKLAESEDQVDHYIEVAEKPELAFDWDNLYLSCHACNSKKLPNTTIPVSDCLNPCDPSENPADHLAFEGEYIVSRVGSSKGSATIQKYRLSRPGLDQLRGRELRLFTELVLELRERQRRDGKPPTQSEKEQLASFKEPQHPYSLMFSMYLARHELL